MTFLNDCFELFAENDIDDEGAKTLSEMLKVNTTLTTLNLEGEEERKVEGKQIKDEQKQTTR